MPYNKSYYSRSNRKVAHKTFFKGAVEYTIGGGIKKNSLADNDHAVKKEVDDNKVKARYKEELRKSKEQDEMNMSMRSSKVMRKTITLKDVVD